MVLAMKRMKESLFPKMVHMTCLAHGLNRVAEFIKSEFEDANEWITNVKQIFRKVSFSQSVLKWS